MQENINHSMATNHCTGCQMCSSVCRENAIDIRLDEEGFYKPYIDESLCINCGQCVEVCAKFDNNVKQTTSEDLSKTTLYSAYSKAHDVLSNTTSGGLADLLAKQLIKDGYKVIGVVYNPPKNIAEAKVALTSEETDRFRGSKYIQSYSVDAFRKIVEECSNVKFAVFGLPCQIYAISRYLNNKNCRDKHLLIDLYCHGCPSMLVWNKVSEDIKKKNGVNQFSNVIWRSKRRGWGKFILEVFANDKMIFQSSPKNNEFFEFFFSDQVLKSSCTNCKFRKTLAYTDIRLGDFWGPVFHSTYTGVSAISVVSDNGKKLFEKITDNICFEEKDYNIFLPYQSWSKTYKIDSRLRRTLLQLLSDDSKTLKESIAPLRQRYSFMKKIKNCTKQILSYFPPQIEWTLNKYIR